VGRWLAPSRGPRAQPPRDRLRVRIAITNRDGGRRAPDLPLTGGGRLYEALRAGRFVLLSPEGDDVLDGWADRVDHATAGGEQLLVRPDGCVAWSAGNGDLRAALARWCGPPA
jgi:aromatic ring hydroxylase-like protein